MSLTQRPIAPLAAKCEADHSPLPQVSCAVIAITTGFSWRKLGLPPCRQRKVVLP